MKTPPLCAPSLAAAHLASQLGGGQALWLARLANWRRASRVGPPPIPLHSTEAGNPAYRLDELDTFIAANLEKQAFVAEARQNSPVRAGATAHLDSVTEAPHVRVSFAITGASQSVYALDSTSARRLADMLTRAADQVDMVTPTAEGGTA